MKNKTDIKEQKPIKQQKKKIEISKEKIVSKPAHPPINREKLLNSKQKSMPEIINFYSKIEKFLNNNLFLSEQSKIVLSVSGGVDSMTMLDVFANLAERYNIKLYIAHFNHKLRGTASDDDEEFVKKAAESYCIPFYRSCGEVSKYSESHRLSIEHAARTLRYKFLERIAKSLNASHIATAHTADDSAETFLINLLRGTGLTGLSGIADNRAVSKKINIIRPFINMKKTELCNYALLRGLVWREDETNSLLHYTRNKIRHDLIPKLENEYSCAIVDLLNRSARLIRGADSYISRHVQKLLQPIIANKSPDRISMKISLLQTHDEFFKGELIQAAITANFHIQSLPLHIIDSILSMLSNKTGTICDINKMLYAIIDRNYLIFSKKSDIYKTDILIERVGEFVVSNYKLILTEVHKKDIKFSNKPNIEFLDLECIPAILHLRTWEQGDTFQPIGLNGTVKISDFLTNIKYPAIDKPNVLVLATKSEIIWVCGKRLSEKFKISDSTRRVIRAEYVEINDNK